MRLLLCCIDVNVDGSTKEEPKGMEEKIKITTQVKRDAIEIDDGDDDAFIDFMFLV